MPLTCGICGASFPIMVRIDGKTRNLSKRKYCLTCSPFGKHNTTTNPSFRRIVGDEVTCRLCGRIYKYDYKKGHRSDRCNSCYVNTRRPLMKKRAVEYAGGGCVVCGYSRCVRALVFHHLDPKKKDFLISRGHLSWEKIKAELKKCVLLCSNCHGEAHEGLVDLRRYVNGRRADR